MEPVSAADFKLFANLPLVKGMERAALDALAHAGRIVLHAKGDIFLALGQPIHRFFVVLDGWCGASKVNAEGQEAILQIFTKGDFLPEPDAEHAGEPSPLNLQALTSLRLIAFPPQAVQEAMHQSPAFASAMLAASIRHNRELRDHIEQLTLHNAEQRVGRFLLQMRFNVNKDGRDITLPFDKALIASYLGIKPETFSRALQAFKENGFVVERNHLIVPDRQALCDYCDQSTMNLCRFAHTDDCPHTETAST